MNVVEFAYQIVQALEEKNGLIRERDQRLQEQAKELQDIRATLETVKGKVGGKNQKSRGD